MRLLSLPLWLKLSALIVLLTTAAAGVLGYASRHATRTALLEEAVTSNQREAQLVAMLGQHSLAEAVDEVRSLSRVPPIAEYLTDVGSRQVAESVIAAYLGTRPHFALFAVLDTDGQVRTISPPTRDERTVALLASLSQRVLADGQTTIGPAFHDSHSGQAVLAIAVPITAAVPAHATESDRPSTLTRTPTTTVGVAAALPQLDVLSALLRDESVANGSIEQYSVLHLEDALQLAHAQPARLLTPPGAGQRSLLEHLRATPGTVSPGGRAPVQPGSAVLAYAAIPGVPWIAISQQETAAILAPLAIVERVVVYVPRWKDETQALGRLIRVKTECGSSHFPDLPGFPELPELPEVAEVAEVAGSESALRELLTNLIFNAVDAMPAGGLITLRTGLRDGRVLLEVQDTGTGMPEAVRQRCLEPFFTTKGERGTGLGLSMVHGIVQRHSGTIEVESAVGAGTTFRVLLPLYERCNTAADTAAPQQAAPAVAVSVPR